MPNLGFTELILIFLVVLLLFGAKRIPEIARGLGKGIREFKDATTDVKRELMVDDTRRLDPPAYGQTQARSTYAPPVMQGAPVGSGTPTPDDPYAPHAPAPGTPTGNPTGAPDGPTGDPGAGLPSTGTPVAPYPPAEAHDMPPPQTPERQG